MTLSPNLLAEADKAADKQFEGESAWMLRDGFSVGVHWLFTRLCELSDARFDFHQIVDSPEFEEFCDSHSFCVTSENHTLAYQAAAFGARHQHSLNMAALLRQREKLAKTREALIAEENAFQIERAKCERLEKALREIAENVDDISSYETARQALSGEAE